VPDLAAEQPDVSADGLTWTIRIRRGLRYAPPLDDVEITAPDFVRALERAATRHPDSYASFFLPIDGFDAFRRGEADAIAGLATPDVHTLEIRLTIPTPDLASRLALPASAPIPPNPTDPGAPLGVAEGHDYDYGRFLVSSGPYMIEGSEAVDFSKPVDEQTPASGFSPGESLVLVRNPSWSPASDPIRSAVAGRIEIAIGFGDHQDPFTGTEAEIAEMVRAGELDVALTAIPGELARRLRADPATRGRLVTQPTGVVRFVTMNLAQPPFDDVHVRRAASLVTDKAGLRDAFEASAGVTAAIARHLGPDSVEAYLLQGYDPYRTEDDRGDVEAARGEMRRSAYDGDGDGLCDVRACRDPIVGLWGPEWSDAAEIVVEGLVGLGIDARIDPRFRDGCGPPGGHVALCVGFGYIIDFPDGANWFPWLFRSAMIECAEPYASVGLCGNFSLVGVSPEQLERWGYPVRDVPNVDSRIERCLTMFGRDRPECWADLDSYLMEEVVPSIPIAVLTATHLSSGRVDALVVSEVTRLPALDRIAVPGGPPGPPPVLATFAEPNLPPGEPGIPEGTYTVEISREDAALAGMPDGGARCRSFFATAACAAGTYSLTVTGTRFTIRSDAPATSCVTGLSTIAPGPIRGTLRSTGRHVVFEGRAPCAGFAWVLRASYDDPYLAFEVVAEAAQQGDGYMRLIFETHPWRTVS
jgi:peptide/nickel transport system substrate-binding protein